MHLFSAPLTLDHLKSLHILFLMGHNKRTKNYKPNVGNLEGNVSWRALPFFFYFCNWQLSSKRPHKLPHKCNIPIPSLLFNVEKWKLVDRAVISRKIFLSEIGTEMLPGEKIHMHMQISGLCESDPDPLTSPLHPATPGSCHSCQSAHLEPHSLC